MNFKCWEIFESCPNHFKLAANIIRFARIFICDTLSTSTASYTRQPEQQTNMTINSTQNETHNEICSLCGGFFTSHL